uniref:Glycosylated integral membrane protein 1 n=2 Tax=Leptobrachium leishanense TaxID=445787 RepID=A0A8C5Q0M8_9ANUR
MEHWIRFSGPSWIFLSGLSYVLLTILTSGQSHPDSPSMQETVRHNVTVFKENENTTVQIMVDIAYRKGQVEVNGFPVSRGVTRITLGMEISSSESLGPSISSVSIRVLVQQRPMDFILKETHILVQQEVISFEGYQVQQNKTTQVEILVNETMDLVSYSTLSTPLEEALLYSLPLANDVLFTFPNIPETGERAPQQTTREYNIRQNTTLDEEPYPGKLPETPIRGEAPVSSYKVMCEYAEYLRNHLCYIWSQIYLVLIKIIKVVVVGVIAAAIVIEVLKILYPAGQQKGVLFPVEIKDSPLLVPVISQETDTLMNSCDEKNIP